MLKNELTAPATPANGFETFKLDPRILAGIAAVGYKTPTPIQAEAIPPLLAGRDLMGLSQTGTGKTAAFVLPILQRLAEGPRRKPRALIIAPTRELTEQTHQAIGELGRKIGLRGAGIYGGVSINPQIQNLRRGVDIIAACPGRLLDHVERKTVDLSAIEVLVLDEADQMFDMGFLPDVKRIIRQLPRNRQNLLFSATMPTDIRVMADEILNDPVRVRIGMSAPADTVSHTFFSVNSTAKTDLLKGLLEGTQMASVLVFTRTKHRSKRLAHQLEQSGYSATALHGNLNQNQRQRAMDGFREGRFRILVATDVAARGIDVRGISHVINYDIPNTVDAYTHRIGRTGRAGETGDALTFYCDEDKGQVSALRRVLGTNLQFGQTRAFGVTARLDAPPMPDSLRPDRPRPERAKAARTTPNNRSSRPRSRSGAGPGTTVAFKPRRHPVPSGARRRAS